MGKIAASKKTTTAEDVTKKYLSSFDVQNRFFAATLGMGWRMAITVLVPLIAGIQVDKHFKSSPSYTLAGFMIAVAGAVAVVANSVKEVNQEQADMDKEANKSKVKKASDR